MGVKFAFGHTLIELPLVIGLALGLSAFLQGATKTIGVFGGAVLIVIGLLQLSRARGALQIEDGWRQTRWDRTSGVVLGLVFTAINPFFLLWWATVGTYLVLRAFALASIEGVLVMFAFHIWMDYAWLGATASLAGRGRLFIGKAYRVILVVFGLVMLYFGATFIAPVFSQ